MAIVRSLLLLVMAAAMTVPAAAQDWPTRPVRILNTFAAGATSDMLARIAAEHLSEVFKQQFYVESKPGGAGAVAIQTVTNAAPDGYNFVLTSAGQVVVAPTMNPKLTYDPMKELVHIAFLAGTPTVFSISPKFGIKTLKELIDYAKKQSGPITYSSSGVGSSGHLVAAAFAAEAGIKADHVPYRGASQSLVDAVAGHVTFASQTVSSSQPQIDSGQLIPLAQSGTQRLKQYPDVPTFAELGYKEPLGLTWFVISGHAKLPADIVAKMNREVNAAMHRPETQEKLSKMGMLTENWTPQQLRKDIEEELQRWKPTIEQAGMILK
jgi:tripartite-type tricarboxylate transporter receptor subunit TctC